MFFKRNNINIGIGLGILVPMLGFAVLFGMSQLVHLKFKTRTLMLIGICLNMIIVRIFQRRRAGESVRGVVMATGGMAVGWFIWFYEDIMSEL